ncbi:MAG: glycosyl transferase [Acidobacteria bacterium]|nr:glycosyl transferase [Acidobacteriota bacterium]
MMKKKVIFYCQHVLGLGHLIRSLEIVRGISEYFDVTLLNGGEITPDIALPSSIVNLPPVKSDAEFRGIHTVNDTEKIDEILEMRKRLIIEHYQRILPDLLVVELFPFGRRTFAGELVPLLEQIRLGGRRTKVVCSLRDILVSKREQAQFEEEAVRIVNQYFDLLLVHSDPRFQRLDDTFPRVADLKCPICYTGFVVRTEPEIRREIDYDDKIIIVSIGGGRVGIELIESAIESSALLDHQLPHRMYIFTGPYLPEAEFERLRSKIAGRDNIILQRFTADFVSFLRRADLSISMAGYNTCMNIITERVRAIVYPFTGNNNQEQSIRAGKLEKLGILDVIHPGELAPESLAEKIISALSKARPAKFDFDLRGVDKTVEAFVEILKT